MFCCNFYNLELCLLMNWKNKLSRSVEIISKIKYYFSEDALLKLLPCKLVGLFLNYGLVSVQRNTYLTCPTLEQLGFIIFKKTASNIATESNIKILHFSS